MSDGRDTFKQCDLIERRDRILRLREKAREDLARYEAQIKAFDRRIARQRLPLSPTDQS